MVKEPLKDGGIEEILSAISDSDEAQEDAEFKVDTDGIKEVRGYETYNKNSQGHSGSLLERLMKDTAHARHEGDRIIQETRKLVLSVFKIPSIIIIGLLVLLIVLNMLTLIIAGGKILYLSWGVSPAEVYKALLEFIDTRLGITFLTPLAAVVVAVAVWLFKKRVPKP